MRGSPGLVAWWRGRPPVRRFCDPVGAVGIAVLLATLPETLRTVSRSHHGIAVLACLTMLGELPTLLPRLRWSRFALGTSMAFGYATLICFGLGPAALLVGGVTLLADRAQRKELWRSTFNTGMHVLCLAGAWVVLGLGHVPALHLGGDRWLLMTPGQLPVVLAGGLAYAGLNTLFVAAAFAHRDSTSLRAAVRRHLAAALLGDTALLTLSPAIVVCLQTSAVFVPLFLIPLVAVYKSAAVSREREHEARHDALTGLPNRSLLLARAEDAIAHSSVTGRAVALFLLDLDRFKEVNDTLGHTAGDRMLQQVAARLVAALRPGDLVARLGGDEFAVVLPGVRDAAAAREVAQRAREALEAPMDLDGFLVSPEASIGVALVPDHAADVATLVQRADVAMYLAKASRRGVEVYSAERDRNSATRLTLLGELRSALERGALSLYYQPKARLAGGDIAGVEALLRWEHPDRGTVGPDDFLPLAEQSGLMPQLTRYVIGAALAQAAAWRREGLDLHVAVNVSVRDLHDATFVEHIRRRLHELDLPGCALVVEVTEGMLMSDADSVAVTLEELAELGVGVSLDDFGTGYSSLVHLRRLPVREIKIDRSFVMRMHTDVDDATIVRSIIELARALGLRVVAEGVQTEEAWRELAAYGCDLAQGWLVARPMPSAAATDWIRDRRRRRPALMLVEGGAGSA